MRLLAISRHVESNLSQMYRRRADTSNRGRAHVAILMAELIEHLEQSVVGPDTYAFTSMNELVLNDEDTSKKRLVLINAKSERWCVPEGYEIAYRVAPPWFHTIGYAEDVVSAGELVLEALRLAVRDE
jgi:hypothetical protein